jgi:hypothetical protein
MGNLSKLPARAITVTALRQTAKRFDEPRKQFRSNGGQITEQRAEISRRRYCRQKANRISANGKTETR